MDRLIEQKRGIRRKHIPYLIGGIFILWFAGWTIFGNHESALRVDKEKITIEDVSQGIFHDYIRIMGNVEPLTFSQLTVQEGGNVKEILVEEGEMVKAGEVIIRLESKNLETEILNSKDRFAEEENSVQNSLLDLEREELNLQQERLTLELDVERKKRKYLQNKQLFEEDLIAKEEYLVAKEDYEYAIHNRELITEKQTKDSIRRHSQVIMLKQKMENARRNLRLTQERYARLNVCAPIDGQLSDLNVEIGQVVSSGSQIGKINVLNDYKVMTQIDEHYIDRVRKGLTATLERQGNRLGIHDYRPSQYPNGTDVSPEPATRRSGRIDTDSQRYFLPKHGGTMDIRVVSRWNRGFPAKNKNRQTESPLLSSDGRTSTG